MDELTSWRVTCNKEEICSHVTMSHFEVDELTSWRVDRWTSCLLTYLLVNHVTLSPSQATCQLVNLPCYFVSLHKQLANSSTYLVTLSLFASNLFTRLTCQLVNFRKLNSQTKNQEGVNSVRINALWACKRCSLRPLLTPFWNPIKHLLVCDFVTYWFSVSCRVIF